MEFSEKLCYSLNWVAEPGIISGDKSVQTASACFLFWLITISSQFSLLIKPHSSFHANIPAMQTTINFTTDNTTQVRNQTAVLTLLPISLFVKHNQLSNL